MQTTKRNYQGNSSATSAAGYAIARGHRGVAVLFPVNPGMVDTK
jgi:hypothetical protein